MHVIYIYLPSRRCSTSCGTCKFLSLKMFWAMIYIYSKSLPSDFSRILTFFKAHFPPNILEERGTLKLVSLEIYRGIMHFECITSCGKFKAHTVQVPQCITYIQSLCLLSISENSIYFKSPLLKCFKVLLYIEFSYQAMLTHGILQIRNILSHALWEVEFEKPLSRGILGHW